MRNTHRRSSVKKVLKQFAKFTVKHRSWSLFLIKFRLDGVQIYQKETPAKAFSCKFSRIFEKTYFAGISGGCLNEMNQKKLCLVYSQENSGKDVLFSAVTDMWDYRFSKRDSITDAIIWKLWSFTESQFYRTLLFNGKIWWLRLTWQTKGYFPEAVTRTWFAKKAL